MATTHRGDPVDIKTALFESGHRFGFIQAVRLLRLMCRQKGTPSRTVDRSDPSEADLWRRHLRVGPELSLDFPVTDIVEIKKTGTGRSPNDAQFKITASFLGLYGASSPLPAFYTEDLMDEAREDTSEVRDFVDILNAPLYALRFECWSKFRIAVKVLEEQAPRFIEQLYCLLGFGDQSLRSQVDDSFGLIRYTGLFMQSPRSASGLETLLRDAMAEPRLKIIPCVTRSATIPDDQRFRLGVSGNRLGEMSYLGRRMQDRMGKFRVRITPLDWVTYQDWLPDADCHNKLGELINLYLDQPLKWDLELILDQEEAHTTCLGADTGSRLGWDTWVMAGEKHKGRAKVRFK